MRQDVTRRTPAVSRKRYVLFINIADARPHEDIMRRTLFAIALSAIAAPQIAEACVYDGVRGYDNPAGNACKGAYHFTARSTGNHLWFRSDGRQWDWSLTGFGDDTAWQLAGLYPATRSGMSGRMDQAPGDPTMRGNIHSGYCGPGYIVLTARPGSCGFADAARPYQPLPQPAQPPVQTFQPPALAQGAMPAAMHITGHAFGGNVRAYPTVDSAHIGSLFEGQDIRIVEDTGVRWNDFNWFRVQYLGGEGYVWGGIICADAQLSAVYTCRS